MSIFGTIVSKIFGSHTARADSAQSPQGNPVQQQGAQQQGAQQQASSQQGTGVQPKAAQQQGSMQPSMNRAPSSRPMTEAEVEGMIANIASKKGAKSNWNESIVDLLKLLDMDSSLSARKQLAQELGYTGALDGSAEMNIWLHKEVMVQIAQSGGKVPEHLKN